MSMNFYEIKKKKIKAFEEQKCVHYLYKFLGPFPTIRLNKINKKKLLTTFRLTTVCFCQKQVFLYLL